jgi:hypothetical protein
VLYFKSRERHSPTVVHESSRRHVNRPGARLTALAWAAEWSAVRSAAPAAGSHAAGAVRRRSVSCGMSGMDAVFPYGPGSS